MDVYADTTRINVIFKTLTANDIKVAKVGSDYNA
jgi:hypothetical protein